jgi:hypothetical protein
VVVVTGRDGAVPVADGVLLVNATWVHADAWFWECGRCECAFGPLLVGDSARDAADAQAREHIVDDHEAGRS